MNFPDALFPQAWALGACLPLLAAWLWCAKTAPWWRLADSGQLNVWLGTVVLLILVWSMKAGVKPGLNPANLFVYIFASAFFGAALTVMATGLLASALLWLADVYPAATLIDDYLAYYLLLGFAEAWLNGALVTLMVVYLPRWVGSFDDRRFLLHK